MNLKNIIFFILIVLAGCNQQEKEIPLDNNSRLSIQDSIKLKKKLSKAFRQNLFSQERQYYLDSVIQISPNYAYFWQQKAMPLFKSKKYELGMKYIDKAVSLNPEKYLDYRAFIKCIFSKNYSDAIIDFEEAKKTNGDNGYVMDHSYDFYIGISYLQLNEFKKAHEYLNLSITNELKKFSEDWIPTLDWFYLGISEFELHNYRKAIINLDKALKQYPTFADAQYYKVKCLARLGEIKQAKDLLEIARKNINNNDTFNEANSVYERYPYQVYKQAFEYFRD
ncbi:MAG: tetratricopeptide repeat protein [Flavobacteriaceae bacterium]|nr:tetratricopeptide repeat protein [Flavobacteriaceae bacterium]